MPFLLIALVIGKHRLSALSSVPSIDAWNPLHTKSAPSAPTPGRAGATVGYSPVTAQAAAPTHTINDVDDELTL